MELISVLIPVFNVEKYIIDSINSILNQTYKNLEIIIVDDCSTDNTYALLEILSHNDKRIKLYKNEYQLNIANTLNYAFTQSNGKYIVRMDGDDISLPNRIQNLYNFISNNPVYDLVGSQTITIDENGRHLNFSKLPIIENNIYSGLKYKMSTIAHIWLAKRQVYETIKYYRIPSAEDYDFLLRMRTIGFRFTNLNEYLYKVRIREGNTLSTSGTLRKYSVKLAYKLYKERLKYGYEITDYKIYILNFNKNNRFKFLDKYSDYFLLKSLKSNSFLKRYFFLTFSVILSPFDKLLFFYNRLRIKLLS